MKLIDILVQELPKRGGWPEGAVCVVQDADGQVCFSSSLTIKLSGCGSDWLDGEWGGNWSNEFYDTIADDRTTAIVTRGEYEATDNGLPPVGTAFEFENSSGKWERATMKYTGERFAIVDTEKHGETWLSLTGLNVRTERDKIIDEIASMIGRGTFSEDATSIYDAIAAGEIPGVKLCDEE